MLKQIAILIYKNTAKFKVIHNIPGRLRIHIPGLKLVSTDLFEKYEEFFTDIFKEVKGIKSVKCCKITGNVLIEYANDLLDDTKILEWLKKMRNEMLNSFLKDFNKEKNFEEKKMVQYLSDNLKEKISKFNK